MMAAITVQMSEVSATVMLVLCFFEFDVACEVQARTFLFWCCAADDFVGDFEHRFGPADFCGE